MPQKFSLKQRTSGILLHPTSLPGPYGIGDFGPAAFRFADQLAAAKQAWWQMLPICPPGPGNAPYNSYSSFAISPLFISPDRLVEDGLLTVSDVRSHSGTSSGRVDYRKVSRARIALLRKAHDRFRQKRRHNSNAYRQFVNNERPWLEDHCRFVSLRNRYSGAWDKWPKTYENIDDDLSYHRFEQFVAARQWNELRRYCNRLGIGVIGDVPIYVAYDSADVWANRRLFEIDRKGAMKTVSGAPPDAFCAKGQKWGHPLYRWKQHSDEGFAWWTRRFANVLNRFDAVRIDHFIGLHRYWSVHASAPDATVGRWRRAPGRDLFERVFRKLPNAQFIAEDLGELTTGAIKLRDDFGIAGMRVLQDGFTIDSYHLPHRHVPHCVAYTGTHDTNTTVGWFRQLKPDQRKRVTQYANCTGKSIHNGMIRLAMSSVANTVIIPMQDLLGLGSRDRMNIPGTPIGNWRWRISADAFNTRTIDTLREMTEIWERA